MAAAGNEASVSAGSGGGDIEEAQPLEVLGVEQGIGVGSVGGVRQFAGECHGDAPLLGEVDCRPGAHALAPEVGEDFIQWRPPSGSTDGLGLVDFAIFPHLAPDGEPSNSIAEAEEWFGRVSAPAYVLDDRGAVVVADGETRVVSEGTWHFWEH
mgnify:CR=1 FL=1